MRRLLLSVEQMSDDGDAVGDGSMLNLWHAYVRAAQAGWDANVVVTMRLMRLALGGAPAQREAQRMVAEKIAASAEAQAAAITKLIMAVEWLLRQNPLPL